MPNPSSLKPGDIIYLTGSKLISGSSKQEATALVVEAIGPNSTGGDDYMVCEIVHNAIPDPANDFTANNTSIANAPIGTPIVKSQSIHIFSIDPTRYAAVIGRVPEKKLKEIRGKVESHLVVNGQQDMPIGVCSDVAFTNGTGSKARPVLVLGESGNFTHICSLTSKNYVAPGKVPLAHTASTNLFHRTSASFVHTQWMTTVPSKSVSLYGTLDSRDKSDVLTALRARYSSIMTVVEKHDRPPVLESKPVPVFKPRKDGIDLEAGVANREEAAGVVAKYYTEICAMVRSEVVRNKMYSLFSSGGLEPHDFVAMAMKNFMAPNSKSDVPATVGGVFAYFTVAAVNRARDVGRKVARAQSVRDYREIDDIDEREYCNSGNSAASDIEASELADHVLTRARAAASTPQMQDALASIEMHAVDGPDEDALYLTDNVRDEYHPSTARLAEIAGMSTAQFIRQKKLIQKSIRLCLQHDPQIEPGELTLASRTASKPTPAHEVKSIA